ncbi:hypothetical protein NDU88_004457 [Pleurodeles waltl]|uniref:Uncharacterized protein n=1 Tax=Pleurodeles waltl TaxID=8319 RepID=A0AAV7VJZ0_PLEWA|nr:hypothetical protein NDU88_004457 [Pleurodeles waltl]
MPQSGSPRDSHLPRCSRAILHALWPGTHHASPKLRGQRSVHAVGHHGHDHPTGGPSIRRSSRSAEGPVLSSLRAALPGPGPFRRCVPVFKVGVRYSRGPFRQTHRAACRVGATARPPGSRAPVLVASPYLRGWGRRARTHPRSPSHRPLRSRKHKAFHDQPCSNPQAGGGGAPVSPAAVGWLPLKRRAVPRPAACPLSLAPGINAATGPRPWGSPAVSDGLRQARSGLHWCSGHPHGFPHSLPVNLPRGVAQDNRRSLGPSGADGSSVRHLWFRGHAPIFVTYLTNGKLFFVAKVKIKNKGQI